MFPVFVKWRKSMMDYEIFKEVVIDKFKDYLPDEFSDMKIETSEVRKVNRTLDAINIIGNSKGSSVVPTIYINDMYDMYQKTNDIDKVLSKFGKEYSDRYNEKTGLDDLVNTTDIKEHVIFQLVNTEQNKEMLANMPHREFKDLSIIYKVVLKMTDEGLYSTTVTNKYAEHEGITEPDLFKCAAKNTKELFPPVIKSMADVIREIFSKDGMPTEIAEAMVGEISEDQMMYVITNDVGINGAVSMLYEDGLHDLAEHIGSDLYILPSSIHEVIAVSADMGNPTELADMVSEVNMSAVAIGDRLSNQVYHYDKDLRKVTLATDTPNKRLDGIVSEAPLVFDSSKSR